MKYIQATLFSWNLMYGTHQLQNGRADIAIISALLCGLFLYLFYKK